MIEYMEQFKKSFKDYFSKHSDLYLKYRPTYPVELFEYLSTLTQEHDLAWDCGTGNGQAATGLTKFYKNIFATDPSEEQIRNALPHKKIIYRVEKAEHSTLNNNSVDLITAAQALHWFEFDKFYAEAKRVLKENGIIAVWIYKLPLISCEIDKIIKHFHDYTVDEFWQFENRLVEKKYSTLHFPFEELPTPEFSIEKFLTLPELLGLIHSWSAVQRFIQKTGRDPVLELKDKLMTCWGLPEQKRKIKWKLTLKVGKNNFSLGRILASL
ncbi:MAG TPA: class I SAM-dependent methyltransferase [Cyclobacteriaceae bacterium]|jgi:SAM-dependent methyltransferase